VSIPSSGAFVVAYRPPDFDAVATPVTTHMVTIRPQKNGPGTFGVAITLDDPAHALIQVNDVIAIRRDGTTVAAGLVEMIDEHTLDEQGGARQIALYSGRLVGAFAEWAVIAPALGDGHRPVEDDSVWDWRSPRYDPADDAWDDSTEIMTVAAAEAGGWPHQPMAADFDLTTGAMMICDASGDDTYADAFWRLFYRDITITTPGRYAIENLMDDKGMFWVDGIEQLDVRVEDGFVRASFKRLELSAGTHRFCWAVLNVEDPENPGLGLGPSALAYNLYKADLQDHPLADGDSWISDDNTKVLYVGEDPFPGMTIGDDLTQLIDEAQARGAITWCVPTFDKDDDSNGDPWDRELGVTTKTGTTTILQFLDELVASGRIARWRWRPDGVHLDVFAPGYSTRPGDVELEPAPVDDPTTGQLIHLDRKIT